MSESIRNVVSAYLKEVTDISLATIDSEGTPYCTVVAQVSEDDCLYFFTSPLSNKVKNIGVNPNVAFTANKPSGGWMSIKSVQMQGTATLVSDETEIGRIMEMLFGKFPLMKDMPTEGQPAIVKVSFTKGWFLDYTKGFSHRDAVTY